MAPRRAPNKVAVFAHISDQAEGHHFVPAGLLSRETSAGRETVSFAYGTRYLQRPNAIEVDPRALALAQARQAEPGTVWYPLPEVNEFGGIRDATPDAWGRRVIEARLNAAPNSLDEFTYLLEAGSDRVAALDVREDTKSPVHKGAGGLIACAHARRSMPVHPLQGTSGAARKPRQLRKTARRSSPFPVAGLAVTRAAGLALDLELQSFNSPCDGPAQGGSYLLWSGRANVSV